MAKKLVLLIFLGLIPFISITPQAAHSSDLNINQLPPMQDVIDPIGLRDTTYHKICKIRRMFCGDRLLSIAIVAATIFAIGCSILVGKARWQFVMVTAVGLAVFTSAEWLFFNMAGLSVAPGVSVPSPVVGVYYSCTCDSAIIDTFQDIF